MHSSNKIPKEDGSVSWSGFSTPVTQQCVEVLINAADLARAFGHDYTGTEHVLLAVLRTPNSSAASVLASLTDPALIVRECEHRLRSVNSPNLGGDPSRSLTRQLEAAIRRAENHASAQVSSVVNTQHLLHGIVDDVTAMAYEVLVAGKLPLADLTQALSRS